MINGVLNIYKEKGFTSHDVVAKLRGICKQKKIGHTGTLDPQAEGVLPVCLGSATKLCDLLTDKHKEYVATMLLGIETDTQDMTGTVLKRCDVNVTEDIVRHTIASFAGKSEQLPPMYSALKVDGKRLYELARAGIEVERKKRPIEIFEIEVLSIKLPEVTFRVLCSKGTYVRTICHDIGAKLGCKAAMSSLLRTRVDQFCIEGALKLAEVEKLRDEGKLFDHVVTVEDIFKELPQLYVAKEYRKLIDNGNTFLPEQCLGDEFMQYAKARVYNDEGMFYGIYGYDDIKGQYKPIKMFFDR